MTDRTRTTGPSEHLDAETLADLQEGLLDPPAARAAEEHLLACAACAADNRMLAGLPDRLAAAGDAGPLPEDVALRIDAALAAEPPVRVAGAATVTPLAPPRSAPAGMRVVQAAAVLVVLLAGVGIALGAFLGGNDDSATTAGAAEDSAAQELPDDGSFPVTASGRSWTSGSVVAAVPKLLAGTLGPEVAAASSAGPDADTGTGGSSPEASGDARSLSRVDDDRLAGGPALAECVGVLNDDPVTPLAVDLATWAGDPATVIVLPTPDDPTTVDVYVVEPSCPPGEFLFFAREPRP